MAINLVQDFFNTKVSTKWNSTGAGNFYIAILPTPTNGYLVVNRASASRREIVRYTGKGTNGGGNYITIALAGDRGLGGTTAQTHEIDESVQMNLTSKHWADLDTAIDAIVAGGAVDASTSQKGISTLSSAPASPTAPIAVGDNDPRVLTLAQVGYVPTVDEKAGIAGISAVNLPVVANGITQSGALQTQLVSTNTIEVGEADATTRSRDLGQRFVATKTKMRGESLFKKADTGTFTGTITVSLRADAGAGIAPTAVDLATVTLTNARWLSLSAAEFEAIFTTEYEALVIGAFYWIVVTTSTADNSNHPNLGADTSGGNGTVYFRNTTNGWVQLASSFLYYKTLEGNVNQVIRTGATGKIDEDLIPVSTATPFFQQDLALSGVEALGVAEIILGSSTDGSQLFVYVQDTGLIYRYRRDAKSGQYLLSHTVDPAFVPSNTVTGGFVVIGIYLYLFHNDGTNIICRRFLAADLTGETTMTVPTVACTQGVGVWSNGVDVYLVSKQSQTTSRRWSVSGTVFTAVSTTTVASNLFAEYGNCYFFDGTFAYLSRKLGNDLLLYRLDNLGGTATTLISTNMEGAYSGFQAGAPAININADLCYQGVIYEVYNATAQNSTRIGLRPISK